MKLFRPDISHRKGLTLCVLALVLLAFGFKALMPAGFMPAIGADGSYEIVICSGSGMKTVTMPADGGHVEVDEAASERCAYQILASAMTLAPVTPVYISAPLTPAFLPSAIAAVMMPHFLMLHQGPRAPPVLV